MNINNIKRSVIESILESIKENMILGLGSNISLKLFSEIINNFKNKISITSNIKEIKIKLKELNMFKDLNNIDYIDLYIENIDEIDENISFIKNNCDSILIKEKIMLDISKKIIFITNNNILLENINNNNFISLEIIPYTLEYVTKKILDIKGNINLKNDFTTINNNIILKINNLDYTNLVCLNIYLNTIYGVIENNIFNIIKKKIFIISKENEFIYKIDNI